MMEPREEQLRRMRWILRIFTVVAAAALLIGCILLIRAALFVSEAATTTATVVANESRDATKSGESRSRRVYRPTFEYVDATGRERSARPPDWSSAYGYRVGEQVEIRYLPDDPETVRLTTFMGTWGFGMILIALGLGVGFIASIGGRAVSRWAEDSSTPASDEEKRAP